MEVYILDSLYRRVDVIDRFESLIWTERYRDIGDMQLVLPSTSRTRSLFTEDMPLGLNESKRVMLVETIEDVTSEDGKAMLKIKGRSLERILMDRVARATNSTTEVEPNWIIQDDPKAVAEFMFKHVCVDLALNAADGIPLYAVGTAYAADSIAPYPDIITHEQEPDTLFAATKNLCDIYDMGFRLYRNGDAGQLFYNIYTGTDRTTEQSTVPAVVFSTRMDTLQSTNELTTVETAKNVAYVVNEQGYQLVYADDVDPVTTTGTDRRVLLVKASKLSLEDPDGNAIDPTPTEIANYLIQVGQEELAKNRPYKGFDGEVNQHSPYVYERDYFLGDLVEMRNADAHGNAMRVVEHIFASDNEGDRSYPTLVTEKFFVPGTWNTWLGNKNWADMGATEYWETQP